MSRNLFHSSNIRRAWRGSSFIFATTEPITEAIEAYKAFDERQPGWIKVELESAA
jgi:threonine dehydrogenase-like Zn-dependent dehydrogenase